MEALNQWERTQLATSYLRSGFPLIKIDPCSKKPAVKGWNADRSTHIKTPQEIKSLGDHNIGLVLAYGTDAKGEPSPFATLDLDDLERSKDFFAGHGIELDDLIYGPHSVLIDSGRVNRTKVLFRLPSLMTTYQHADGDHMIFELRCADANGNSYQDVLPPSIHPDTGKPYRWGGKGNFTRVPMMPAELVDLWKELSANAKPAPKPNGKAEPDALDDIDQPTLAEVRECLAKIKVASLTRMDWIKCGMAIHSVDDGPDGLHEFDRWSMDDDRYKAHEIPKQWDSFKRGGGITGRTLFHYVNEFSDRIPADGLPLPSPQTSEITSIESAKNIWGLARKYGKAYHREGVPVELVAGKLEPITSTRLCTLVEELASLSGSHLGTLTKYSDRKPRWKSATLTEGRARKMLGEPNLPRELLQEIKVVSPTPFLTKDGSILSKGFHPEYGVLVLDGQIAEVDLQTAVKKLKELLRDFKGRSSSDESRMMAAILTPALKPGRLIEGHTPVFFLEANESQTGKGTYAELVPAIYGDFMAQVKQAGAMSHNSVDRQTDAFMHDGRGHICFDNFRGTFKSPVIEAIITGSSSSHLTTKKYAAEKAIDPAFFNWYLTSNGVKTSPDMFNRYCVISMLKQPAGYEWAYGDKQRFHGHVRDSHPLYLGCVLAVWREWIKQGCPESKGHGHNFIQWGGACDYVLQNFFDMPPLMADMDDRQYAGDPDLSFLRELALLIKRNDRLGEYVMPSEIAVMLSNADMALAGSERSLASMDERNQNIQTGRVLGRIFEDAEEGLISVAGFDLMQRKEPPAKVGHNPKMLYAVTEASYVE